MSDCCPASNKTQQAPKQYYCPKNNKKYGEVPYKTILHHVKEPWKLIPKKQTYYYCSDPECDVVYYGHDNSTILKDQIRTKIGIKESSDNALICYCFGVTKSAARANDQAKAFVIEQTKNSLCSCTTHNPSGKCCLKDFPK